MSGRASSSKLPATPRASTPSAAAKVGLGSGLPGGARARPETPLVPKTGPKSRTFSARLQDDPQRSLSEDTLILVTDFVPPAPMSPFQFSAPKPVVPIPRFEEREMSTPSVKLPSTTRRSERIMDNHDSPFYRPCEAQILKARRNGDYDFKPPKERARKIHGVLRSIEENDDEDDFEEEDDETSEEEEEDAGYCESEDEEPRRQGARNRRPSTLRPSKSTGRPVAVVAALPAKKRKRLSVAMQSTGKVPVIAFAAMTKADEKTYADTMVKLGCKVVTNVFRDNVHFTHMVVGGQNPQNSKVALGIARGAWIVSADWIVQCSEEKYIVDPAEFEIGHLPGAAKARKSREHLLDNLGLRIIGDTNPPPEELKAIIEAAGGSVVSQAESSVCIVSERERARKRNLFATVVMREERFLDAIFNGVVPPAWIQGGKI